MKQLCYISQRKYFFRKIFETSFVSNIIALFCEFQCHGTDTFGFFQLQVLEIHIQGNFLHK